MHTLKIVGVGGAGTRAMERLSRSGQPGVELIAIDTDEDALSRSGTSRRIQIGRSHTRGLGAGDDPVRGREVALESLDEIRESLEEPDVVLIVAGLGGGTGSGATPVVAQASKDTGAIVVGVVAEPFAFVGNSRRVQATQEQTELSSIVDLLVVVPSEAVLRTLPSDAPLSNAFLAADEILAETAQDMVGAVSNPGTVNVDSSDLGRVLEGRGISRVGLGRGRGEGRGSRAAQQAMSSLLLSGLTMQDARFVLIAVSGGNDLGLAEVSEVSEAVQQAMHQDAEVVFTSRIDESLTGELRVTLILGGTEARSLRARHSRSASGSHEPEPVDVPSFLRCKPDTEPDRLDADSQPAPLALTDNVHFALTAPQMLAPGRVHILDVWVFMRHQRDEAMRMAQEDATGRLRIKRQGPVRISRGVILEVGLKIDGLLVDPAAKRLLWDAEIGNASFGVTVPDDAEAAARHGVALVLVNGLEILRLDFSVTVGGETTRAEPLAVVEKRHRTAFACYANEDRAAVLARVHGLEKAGTDVFMDVLSLRSGQRYEEVLLEVIPKKDVFYLFWSRAASRSTWVEKEWRCAMTTRGIEYIDPFPLVSPHEVPPPPELAQTLHFNDRMLAHLSAESGSRGPGCQ